MVKPIQPSTGDSVPSVHCPRFSRRSWLGGAVAGSLLYLLPKPLRATPAQMQQAILDAFGNTPINTGRVQLKLPALAENGNSVRLTVGVDSAMTEADHVRFVQLFAEHNPLPDIARFEFTALAGKAQVETRIRLSAEQDIVAVAGFSDGSLWSGAAHIVVTEAACIDALL